MEPVVLDVGSGYTKAGIANPDNEPPLVLRTALVPADDQTGIRTSSSGQSADALKWPVQRGQIVDWEVIEDFWHYIFYNQLGWEEGNEGQVLYSEPLFSSKSSRERLAQVMFENFNVSGLYVLDQAVLSLYSTGRLSGCAVDIGFGKIDIAPVVEGAVLHSVSQQIPIGGKDLTQLFGKLVSQANRKRGDAEANGASEVGVSILGADGGDAERLKEKCAAVAEDAAAYVRMTSGDAEPLREEHTLPDGQVISVGRERYTIGEALFRPALAGLDTAGIAGTTLRAITAGPQENQRQFLENVVLCGGSSLVSGLEARLLNELSQACPPSIRPLTVQPPEYMPDSTLRYSAWMGGAILAKVVFPQNQHITKTEYDEHGPFVVHKKGF